MAKYRVLVGFDYAKSAGENVRVEAGETVSLPALVVKNLLEYSPPVIERATESEGALNGDAAR